MVGVSGFSLLLFKERARPSLFFSFLLVLALSLSSGLWLRPAPGVVVFVASGVAAARAAPRFRRRRFRRFCSAGVFAWLSFAFGATWGIAGPTPQDPSGLLGVLAPANDPGAAAA
jgi:hypothetical protein